MGQGQLRAGLVGAGPWAKTVHAPGLADHPGMTLRAVWARRPEAAKELAEAHGAQAVDSFDELLDQVDAVAFAVPPAVQAELAVRAAEAGKHLILEKPIAADLDGARRLADAVETAGVAALVVLILRFSPMTREWLDGIKEAGGWRGGGARWLSGALLGGQYQSSAWRHDSGALADIGPHALDLLDAALGEITDVLAANRTDDDLWQLLLAHEGGATSTATLSLRLPIQPTVVEVAVYGEHGYRTLGRKPGSAGESYTALLDDFAAMAASGTTSHPCDVRRGLHLQKLLEHARQLAGHGK
ncbi:dehydrogenase [Amycolatopsis sp. WAC 04182]|uniref:Gfo/Idh/MocA family protein n=1 Tax=Amycolatopsis sp. WAC 04182 TaxID=2203198 RepID=UPI000F78B743|nr:Gfo/Idh/MocA family oxidoreductase [Amycolatopsis sp. WAC 04182]RSN59226.1 dehydrogenase [Amycolatopsis sp. WAC 04182]